MPASTFTAVRNERISGLEESETSLFWRSPLPQSYVNFVGRRIVRFFEAIHGLGAFALITFGVLVTKLGRARDVVHPLILAHASRSGWRLLPMIIFLALALGLAVIGQTVSLLNRVGAQ